MKTLVLIFFVVFIYTKTGAQNLISNGSFEILDTIPYLVPNNFPGQIRFARPWYGWEVDLFSSLSQSGVSTPKNLVGYSYPKTGNNYAGIIMVYGNMIGVFNNYSVTEIIEIKLNTPLIAHNSYKVEFYVSLADSSNFAIDYISVYFSKDSLLPVDPNFPLIPILYKYLITPQLSHKGLGIVSDTSQWTKISFDYIATGNEKYIHIGGFLDSIQQNNYSFFSNSIIPYSVAYYYIDDISLYPSDTLPPQAQAGPDRSICWGDSVQIGSHNYADYFYRYKAGLQSSIWQTSDSGVIWVAPKYTTSYVVECTDFRFEKSYDTVIVNVELCGLQGKTHLICKGDSIRLNDTIPDTFNHLWIPDYFLSSAHIQSPHCNSPSDIAYIHQTFDASDSLILQDTIIVQVANCAHANAGKDTLICRFDSLQIGVENEPYFDYQWFPDLNLQWPFMGITTAWPYESTTYILIVSDTLGHEAADTVYISVKGCKLPPEIIIPNIFTPNGDGYNEVFVFKNQEFWHLNVEIFNRWGNLIFQGNETKPWDGYYDGQKISDGVYFYSISAWAEGVDTVLEYRGTVSVLSK